MWYEKESKFEKGLKKAVPVILLLGCGSASYYGARKGIEHAVEAVCKSVVKAIPALETLINKADTDIASATNTTENAPAAEAEVETYKEALKHLMAENAALKQAAAKPAEDEVPAEAKVEAN